MKPSLLLSIVLGCVLAIIFDKAAIAQSILGEPTYYTVPNYYSADGTVFLSDSTKFITGRITGGQAWVLELDSKNKILHSKKFETKQFTRIGGIAKENSNIYVYGEASYSSGIFFSKLDSNFNLINLSSYDSMFVTPGTPLLKANDNSYLVSSTKIRREFNSNSGPELWKFSKEGVVLWRKRTTLGDTNKIGYIDKVLIDSVNNGYLFGGNEVGVGRCNGLICSVGDPWKAFFMRTDMNGKRLWAKSIDFYNKQWTLTDYSLMQNGDIIFTGYYIYRDIIPTTLYYSLGIVGRLGNDGTLKWIKSFNTKRREYFPNSIKQYTDSTFLILGTDAQSGAFPTFITMYFEISNTGKILRSSYFNSGMATGAFYYGENLHVRKNNSLIIGYNTGSSSNPYWSGMGIIDIDSTHLGCYAPYTREPDSVLKARVLETNVRLFDLPLPRRDSIPMQISDIPVCVFTGCRPPGEIIESVGATVVTCLKVDTILDARNPGFHYLWSTGDTTRTIHVTSPGKYYVAIYDACFTYRDSITLGNPGNLDLWHRGALTVDACTGNQTSILINPILHGGLVTWNNGLTSDTIHPKASGLYFAQVVKNGCVIKSDTLQVKLRPSPPPPLIGPDTIYTCGNALVSISILNPNDTLSLLWNDKFKYPKSRNVGPGRYWASYTNKQGCVTYSDTVDVIRTPPSQISASANSICAPNLGTVFIVNPSIERNWVWSNGVQDSLQIHVPPGDYWLTATSKNGCTRASNIVSVTKAQPSGKTILTIKGVNPFCTGDSVILTANGSEPIRWSNGYSGRSQIIKSSGNYTAISSAYSGACPYLPSDVLQITENPRPRAQAGPDQELCEGESAALGNSGTGGIQYTWRPSDLLSLSSVANPIFSAPADIIRYGKQHFTYILTVTTNTCQSSDTVQILVHYPSEPKPTEGFYCVDEPLFIPNVITPNKDGKNDFFYINRLSTTAYKGDLTIFNRYGIQVYSKSTYLNDWDGDQLTSGTYYYRLIIEQTGTGKTETYRGWVEVEK